MAVVSAIQHDPTLPVGVISSRSSRNRCPSRDVVYRGRLTGVPRTPKVLDMIRRALLPVASRSQRR